MCNILLFILQFLLFPRFQVLRAKNDFGVDIVIPEVLPASQLHQQLVDDGTILIAPPEAEAYRRETRSRKKRKMDGLDSDSDKSVESDEDSVLAAFERSSEREKKSLAVDGGKDIESDNTSKQDIFVKILQELSSLNEKVDSLLTKDGDTSLELDNLISRVETLEKGIVDKDGLVSRTDAALVFRFVCVPYYFYW